MILKQMEKAVKMTEDYSFLKADVIKSVLVSHTTPENYLDILLRRYREIINSPREMSNIRRSRNLHDLLAVLEHRDFLSTSDVKILVEICHLLKCPDSVDIVNQYKKQHNLSNNSNCDVCGNAENQSQIRKNEESPSATCVAAAVEKPDNLSLDAAIERVSRRLGKSWKNLARTPELGFTEYDIDSLEADYRFMQDQIRHMFLEWREREGKKATLLKLSNALLKARRKDLAELLDDSDDD